MLDMGFADDVLKITQDLSAQRQTILFTATLSRAVRDLADRLTRNAHWMEVERSESNEAPIDEHVLFVDNRDHRMRLLNACLTDSGMGQAIVFTATKRLAEELAGDLLREGVAAQALHGDLTQRDRTRALNKLRRGECKVLVATDVAARGIDVLTITHVINFEMPRFAEDYVHRIGRTGRAGATGQALSFVGRDEVISLRKVEHFIGRKIQVSEIEGHEGEFRPSERTTKPKRPGTGFRGKPGAPRGRKPGAAGYSSGHGTGHSAGGRRPEQRTWAGRKAA